LKRLSLISEQGWNYQLNTERVVIFCPKGVRTGGPKDLHQLGNKLKNIHFFDAVMCDLNPNASGRETAVPHVEYKKYEMNWIREDDIEVGDILVFPETMLMESERFDNRIKLIWWLSLYNGLSAYNKRIIRRYEGLTNNQFTYFAQTKLVSIGHILKLMFYKLIVTRDLIHLTQSNYAEKYLRFVGFQTIPLRDFLDDFWLGKRNAYICRSQNRILTNGAKNNNIIQFLENHRYFKNYEFLAIKGKSQSEIEALFMNSAAYLDFGYHPGKDHLPREAASLGLPIILNSRGAASNSLDYVEGVRLRIRNPYSRRGLNLLRDCLESITRNPQLRVPINEAFKFEETLFEKELEIVVREIRSRRANLENRA
jgi:hypothetical protein